MVVLGGESTGTERGVVTRAAGLEAPRTRAWVVEVERATCVDSLTGAVAEAEVLEARARTQFLPVVRAVVGVHQRSPE